MKEKKVEQLQVKRLLMLAEPQVATIQWPSHILIKKSAEINQISEELTESGSKAHLDFSH